MKNDFTGFAKHQKEKLDKYFRKDEELTFKKIAVGEDNFYFIYKSKAVILKDKIASYELIPLGFIHNTDDEYYYYVKAVPKIVVSTPEKTVKRINERQETEIMDTAEVRKKAKKQAQEKARQSEQGQKKKKRPAAKRRNVMDADVDQELLRRSFENDPDMR